MNRCRPEVDSWAETIFGVEKEKGEVQYTHTVE
jgi:hypothetical protein